MKIKSLDGLRGIAAIFVFLCHMRNIASLPPLYTPYRFFEAGHEAVILFFILSGYVLTYSQERYNISYAAYICRRIFRIYPTYYLSMIVGVVLFLIIKPYKIASYTEWFNGQFPLIVLSTKVFIQSVVLITKQDNLINGAAWSLVYEVIISIFMLPILFKYKKLFNNSLIAIITISLCWQISKNVKIPFVIAASFNYFIYFYIGYLAFYNTYYLKYLAYVRCLPIYLVLFTSQFFSYGYINEIHHTEVLAGLGSIGFIACCIHNQYFAKLLESKLVQFYGKISYSFYLFHMSILYLVIYNFRMYLNLLQMKILIFLLTTFVSLIVYKVIEINFIKFGKHIVKKERHV